MDYISLRVRFGRTWDSGDAVRGNARLAFFDWMRLILLSRVHWVELFIPVGRLLMLFLVLISMNHNGIVQYRKIRDMIDCIWCSLYVFCMFEFIKRCTHIITSWFGLVAVWFSVLWLLRNTYVGRKLSRYLLFMLVGFMEIANTAITNLGKVTLTEVFSSSNLLGPKCFLMMAANYNKQIW
jgi:hypothetical protein